MRVWFLSAKTVTIWLLACLGIGIFLGTGSLLIQPVSSNLSYEISGKTILIDAGHGGVDPGATGPSGVHEKEITLAIAVELERLLNQAAVFTVMVRRDDRDLADPAEENLMVRKRQDLQRRVEMAASSDSDLYLSIHANYFPSPIWSGAQTFYYDGKEEGQRLAVNIQNELVRQLGPNTRVARPGNFRVLRETAMPAALIEVGFLSNPREDERLADPEYQRRVAAAIFSGILNYLAETDSKGE